MGAEHVGGVPLALADGAAMLSSEPERRALDSHVGAEEILPVEVEERPSDGRLEKRDAALMPGRSPRVLPFRS
jgi:hypothetical protein